MSGDELEGCRVVGDDVPDVNARAIARCARKVDKALADETVNTAFSFAVSYLVTVLLRFEAHYGPCNWEELSKAIGDRLAKGRQIMRLRQLDS